MTIKTPVFLLFLLLSAVSVHAQWFEGNREQTIPTKSNGYLLVTGGTMIFWNQEHQFQTSTDNGATWNDAQQLDFVDENTQVTQMVAIGDTVYAAMNFWWTRGLLLISTDKGNTWDADTSGLGVLFPKGLPFIKDIVLTPGRVLTRWDYGGWTIKSSGSPHKRAVKLSSLNINAPIAKKDSMFFYSWTDTTFYCTTDGGLTLIPTQNISYQGKGSGLVLDGNRMYAASIVYDQSTSGETFLQYSDDNAQHWTPIGKLPFGIRDYIVIGNHIEAACNGYLPGHMMRSTDLGKTWEIDTLGLNHAFRDSVINFAYTPDGSLWVVSGTRNIFKQKVAPSNSVHVFSEHQKVRSSISEDVLHVTIESDEIRSIALYDILGRVQKTISLPIPSSTASTPVTDLTAGCYWALVRTTQGGAISVKVLVD